MITKYILTKAILISVYVFLLSFFVLIYRQELNICLSKEYVLMQDVKIDSIYRISHSGNRNGHSHYITFKDSGKKNSLLLKENTLIQEQILTKVFHKDNKLINLIKREKNKSFFPQNTVYFTYDERFVCDENGKCDFTRTYKKTQLAYLMFGAVIFIGITYSFYRVYNSQIIKNLKREKLNPNLK